MASFFVNARRSAARTFIVAAALLFILGALAPAAVHPFSRQGMRLHEARHSHTATLLDDGTILIVGGRGAERVLSGSERIVPSADDVVVGSSLIAARADHTATAVAGGRVVVAGGRDAVLALDTTEIFDTASGAFSVGPRMTTARSGHTAVRLPNDELLLVGGDDRGSAEILDRDAQQFRAVAGSMHQARRDASAIVLADGRVLIAGGRNANGEALASAEIFDPGLEAFAATGAMTTARVSPSMRLLPDGKVQLFGGDDAATMEIWNPNGYFTAKAFVTAIGGGAETVMHSGASLALAGADGAELKMPRGSRSRSIDAMAAIASKSRGARVSTGQRTFFIGGIASNLASSTVTSTSSSDAWVTTDKSDYSPGETVTITGGGFAPGENVKLYLERNPDNSPNSTIWVTADEEGRFADSTYVCEDTDIGVTFTLTATGQSSGFVAITSFTDGNVKVASTTGSFTVTVNAFGATGCGGSPTETKSEAIVKGAGSTTISLAGNPPSVRLVAQATSSEGGSFVEWLEIIGSSSSPTTNHYSSMAICSAIATGNTSYVAVYTVPAKQTPSFSNLTSASIVYGTASTAIGGTIGSSSPYPTGSIAITLDGVTQNATIGAAGTFSTAFATNLLPVSGSPYAVSFSYAGDSGYLSASGSSTLTVTPLPVTGNFTADDKVYDGNATATISSATVNGVINGDDVALSGGAATFDDANAGNDKTVTGSGFSLSGADAGNYSLGSVATTTADITPLGITGSFTAADKTYDGNTSATILSRSLTGVIGSDDVSLSGGTATFDDENAGTDKTVTGSGFTLDGADAGNYSLGIVADTTADITPLGITGSFTAADKTYDGNTSATITARSLTGGIGSDDVSLSGGTATFDDENAGTDKTVTGSGFTLDGADAANYSLGSVATTTADITPLGITGSFTAANKTYDGNTDATILSRSLTGVIGSDDVSLSGGTATFDDENAGTDKTVTGSGFTLDGADAANYSLGSVADTTADITRLGITGSFTAADKTYDGNTDATILSRSLTGVIGSDDVSLSGGTATFSDKNAGTGKTVTATGFTLSGADAANYLLASGPWTTTANIDRATAALAVNSYAINCGDSYPTPSGVASGLLAGDGISFTYTIASTASSSTSSSSFTSASYPINAVANANANLANYNLTITPGSLVVTNSAPAVGPITGLPTTPIAVGTTIGAAATFSDSNDANAHTAVWNWGSGTTNGTVGATSVSGSYKYTAPGVYQVAVTVTDACGLAGETVYQYVVVYDPNGAFVTGGGWINSPAGAFKADETLVGRANFGFVSKYQKGASIPTGNTEFQFKVADLNFRSTSYEWLVVSGSKAKYKGSGTINGVAGYDFLISAIDGQVSNGGGVDKFRIKIWNASGVVYDNNVNGQTGDDADPATAIEGGSITVHTK